MTAPRPHRRRPGSPVALVAAAASALGLSACESPEQFLGVSIATLGVVGLLALVFIAVAIIDLVKRPMPLVEKLVWAAVIWFVPFIGAIVYWFIGRK